MNLGSSGTGQTSRPIQFDGAVRRKASTPRLSEPRPIVYAASNCEIDAVASSTVRIESALRSKSENVAKGRSWCLLPTAAVPTDSADEAKKTRRGNLWVTGTFRKAAGTSACLDGEGSALGQSRKP